MGSRIIDLFVVTSWLIAMAWLAARDVVPRWFATQPPESTSLQWLARHGHRFQYGLFAENAVRAGTAWSTFQVGGQAITRTDTLLVQHLPLCPWLVVQTRLEFLSESELDEIEVLILGVQAPIKLAGERQGPRFAFQLSFDGEPAHEFVLDSEAAQTLCDTIKPFSALSGLFVGQSWSVQALDPFSLIQGSRRRLKPVLVTVTGRDVLRLHGREQPCFVVETSGARAWVAEDGRVLLQRVEVPGLGMIEIQEESFQRERLDFVLQTINENSNRARIRHPAP